jgi:hypothetical protein
MKRLLVLAQEVMHAFATVVSLDGRYRPKRFLPSHIHALTSGEPLSLDAET